MTDGEKLHARLALALHSAIRSDDVRALDELEQVERDVFLYVATLEAKVARQMHTNARV